MSISSIRHRAYYRLSIALFALVTTAGNLAAQPFYIYTAPPAEAQTDWTQLLKEKNETAKPPSPRLEAALQAYQADPRMGTAIDVLRHYQEMSSNKDLRHVFLDANPRLFKTLDAAKYELVMQTQRKMKVDGKPIGHSWRVGSTGARHQEWLKWKREGGDFSNMPGLNKDKQFQSDDDVTNFLDPSRGDRFDERELINGEEAAKVFMEVTEEYTRDPGDPGKKGAPMHPGVAMIEFLSPTKAYPILKQHIPAEWSRKYEAPSYLQAWVSSDKEKYNGDWAVTQLEHWAYDIGVVTTEFGPPGDDFDRADNPVNEKVTTAYADKYAQLSPEGRLGPPAWPPNDLFGWMANQHRQIFDTHGKDLEEGEIKYLQKYTIKRMKTAWQNLGLDLPSGYSDGDMSHQQLLDFNKAMLVKAHEMHVDVLTKSLADAIRRAPSDVEEDGTRGLERHVNTEVGDVSTEIGKAANALAIAYSNLDPEALSDIDGHLDEIIDKAVSSIEGEDQYRADVAKYLKSTLKTAREGGSQLSDQAAAFRYARSTLGTRLNNHLVDLSGRTLDAFLVDVAIGRKFVRDPGGFRQERQLKPTDVEADLRVIEGVSRFFGWSDADFAVQVQAYFKQDLDVGIMMLQKLHRITSGQWSRPQTIRYTDAEGNPQVRRLVPTKFSEGVSFGIISFKAALKYGQKGWGYYGRAKNGAEIFKNLALIMGPGVSDEDAGRAHAQIATGALGLGDVSGYIETNYGKGLGAGAKVIEAAVSLASKKVLTDEELKWAGLNLAKDLVGVWYPPVAIFSFVQGATTEGYNWWSLTSSQSDLVDFIVENGDWKIDHSKDPDGKPSAVKDPELLGIYLYDGSTKTRVTDFKILAKKIRDSRYAGGYHFLETEGKQIDPRKELLNIGERTGAFAGFEPLQIVKEAVDEIVCGWNSWRFSWGCFMSKWGYTEEWVNTDLRVDVSPMVEDSRTRLFYNATLLPGADNSALSLHIRKNAADLITEYWAWQQQIIEDKVLKEVLKEAVKKKLQEDMEDMPELVLLEQAEKLKVRMTALDQRVWPTLARSADPYPGEEYDRDTDINITKFYLSDLSDGVAVEWQALEDIETWLGRVKLWKAQGREPQPTQITKWFAPDAMMPPIETISTVREARTVGQEVLRRMTDKMQKLEAKYDKILADASALSKYVATSDKYAFTPYHLALTGTVQSRVAGTTGDVKLTADWAGQYREERITVRNDIWARNPGVVTPNQNRNPTVPQDATLAAVREWSRQWVESIRQRFLEDYFQNLDATETHPYFPYLTRLRYQIRKLTNMEPGAGEMSDAELATALGQMKHEKVAVGYDPAKSKAETIAEVSGKLRKEYDSIIANLFDLVGVELTMDAPDYKLLGKYKATVKVKEKATKPSLTAEEIGKFITAYRWTIVSENDIVMNVTTKKPEIEFAPIHAGKNHIQVEPVTAGGLPLGYANKPFEVGTFTVSGELEINGSFTDPSDLVEVRMGARRRRVLESKKSVVFNVEKDRISYKELLDLEVISKLPNGGTSKEPFMIVPMTKMVPVVYGDPVGVQSVTPGKIELDDIVRIDLEEGVTVHVEVVDVTGEPVPDAIITIEDNFGHGAKSPPGKLALPLQPGHVVLAKARLEEPQVSGRSDPVTYDPMQRMEIKVTLPVFMPSRLVLDGTIQPPAGETPPIEIASGEIGKQDDVVSIAQGGTFSYTNREIVEVDRGFEFDAISVTASNNRLIRSTSIPVSVSLKPQEEQDPVEIKTETYEVSVDPIQILVVDWVQVPIFDNPRMTVTVDGVPASKQPNVFHGTHSFKFDNEEVTLKAEWVIPEGRIEGESQLSIAAVKDWETKPHLDEVQHIELPVYLPGNVAIEGEILEGDDPLSDLHLGFPSLGHKAPIAQAGRFTVVPKFPLPRRSRLAVEVEALAGGQSQSRGKDIATEDVNGVVDARVFDFKQQASATDHADKIRLLGEGFERERDAAIQACNYKEAFEAQTRLVNAVSTYLADTFGANTPPALLSLKGDFESDLENLRKAADAEETARLALQEAAKNAQLKDWEAAAKVLVEASNAPDLPSCTQDKVAQGLQTIDAKLAELEAKVAEVITKVEACEMQDAQVLAEPIATEVPLFSWVEDEYPKIQDFAKREEEMMQYAVTARKLEKEADALAQSDRRASILKFNAAIDAIVKAWETAPDCHKKALGAWESHLSARAKEVASDQPTGTPPLATSQPGRIDRSLVFLIDASGSMDSQNKLTSAKSAAIQTVKALGSNVEVALITYSGDCNPGGRLIQEFTTDKTVIEAAINGIRAGGSTPMAPGINFARSYLEGKFGNGPRSTNGQIILLSDGQNNCGSVSDAGSGVARSSMSIKVDAVGLGLASGSQADQDLQDLVRSSGGTQYSANSSDELVQAFRRASVYDQVKWDDPSVDPAVRASLQNLIRIATDALKAKQYDVADAAFKQAVDAHPQSPVAHYNYFVSQSTQNKPATAIKHGEKYLQLAPNALDAGDVRLQIDQLRRELAENPSAVFSPNDCADLYQWALTESSRVRDSGKKARAFRIMTAAQRGDCELATAEFEAYTGGS